ncbi:hypothetical protein GCM10007905_36130 [Mixta theicola]|nr:hypothetical protein GCM10007905_36130 [Mixta theicola]
MHQAEVATFFAPVLVNRRWLPVDVLRPVAIGAVQRDLLQLWTEARERFKQGGIQFRDAERLGVAVHD